VDQREGEGEGDTKDVAAGKEALAYTNQEHNRIASKILGTANKGCQQGANKRGSDLLT
jgi:hypothetical protein